MKRFFTLLSFLLIFLAISFGQAGVLDSTFADNGILTWDVSGGGAENGHGMAVQEDGKIVIALSSGFPGGNFFDIAVVRLNVDGSIDSTFAENGVYHFANGIASDLVYHLELLDDGKILIGGGYGAAAADTEFLLIKLNQDGNPDTSFGTDGIVIHPIGVSEDYIHSMVIDEEGRIIVGGNSKVPGFFASSNVLCRYKSNGVVDTTFGTNGIYMWGDEETTDEIWDVAFADDGNIIACGKVRPAGTNRPSIYKIFKDGSGIDSTFANNGEIIAPFEGYARDMIIHSNGNILITGSNSTINGEDMIVLAYNKDGSPNTNFGVGGTFLLNAAANDYGHSLIEQSDGKILIGGESGGPLFPAPSIPIAFICARISADGILDTSWAEEGYVTTETSTWMAWAHEVALQPDGKVLLAGMAAIVENDLAVTRYGNYIDADMDGYEMNEDCDDANANVNPGMEESPYNGLDDDCDPATPDDDLDGDGFLLIDDCDETNPNINPDAEEIPDNDIDEDCDGMDLTPVNETLISSQFRVYPNPANDRIFITYDSDVLVPESIEIHDPTGRRIELLKNFPIQNTIEVKFGDYPQGLLFITIHTNKGIAVKRIAKL